MEDVMRVKNRQLTPEEVLAVKAVKEAGNKFVAELKDYVHVSRELSVAITNAEQSVMWAVKGITG